MFTAGNDKKRHLEKGQDVDCGRGMIDLITGECLEIGSLQSPDGFSRGVTAGITRSA